MDFWATIGFVNFDASVGVYNTGTTDATDGQTVATWADQSSNGNDGTQSTEASKPVFTSGAFSGAGGVTFASGDFMDLTSAIAEATYASYTCFGVVDRNTASSQCWTLGGSGNTASYPLVWYSDDGIYVSDNNVTDGYRVTTSGKNETGEHILTSQIEDATTGIINYDGVSQSTNRGNVANGDSVYLGRRATFYSDCIWGQILLIDDVLTSGEIDEVESELAAKFGITL